MSMEDDYIVYASKLGIRHDQAPTWMFDQVAVEEIIAFALTLPKNELDDIEANVPTPPVVNIELRFEGITIIFTVFDSKQHPQIENPPARFGTMYKGPIAFQEEEFKTASAVGINCLIIRCMFKNRYVEKLTKHQERILKRGGSLSATDRRIISVAWDAPTPTYLDALEELTRPEPQHTGRQMPLHDVKSFTRRYRSGKVVQVAAHKRGRADVPRKTIIKHHGHE